MESKTTDQRKFHQNTIAVFTLPHMIAFEQDQLAKLLAQIDAFKQSGEINPTKRMLLERTQINGAGAVEFLKHLYDLLKDHEKPHHDVEGILAALLCATGHFMSLGATLPAEDGSIGYSPDALSHFSKRIMAGVDIGLALAAKHGKAGANDNA